MREVFTRGESRRGAMRLFEHESKRLLRDAGVVVPEARLVASAGEARAAAGALGGAVVVKAQVLHGGRGRLGLIRTARDSGEAGDVAAALLAATGEGGEPVRRLLIERQVVAASEFYLAVTLDANESRPALMLSARGGVDIEDTARASPDLVHTCTIDVREGLQPYAVRELARAAGLPRELQVPLGRVGEALWRVFAANDVILAEINPLAVTPDGRLVALDAKIEIDGYCEARHPEFDAALHRPLETPTEACARAAGLSYVELDGTVGIAGNGAGLMMLTVDLLARRGLAPANFCDAGGAVAKPGSGRGAIDWWSSVVGIVLSNPRVDTFFFNLHGGNHRGDEVAEGLIKGLQKAPRRVPMVVRLSGTREAEGAARLASAGITCEHSLPRAIDALARLAGGRA